MSQASTMAFQVAATPMRPIPGAFINTPAFTRQNDPVRRRLNFGDVAQPAPPRTVAADNSQVDLQQQGQPLQQQQGADAPLPPITKAAALINRTLQMDEAYPDLDSYCRPGASSDYDLHPLDMPWAPFKTINIYKIPDPILGRLNAGQVGTRMGLFSHINHAWASIDSSLFLWDYTHPNPEVIGYEDSAYNITAVGLVPPRKGVFIDAITHLLVVAAGSEIALIGVSATATPAGFHQIALYQTKMLCHRGGPDVSIVAGSASGRIFFGGDTDTDVYELYYQQEEKWFSSRVGKINHTRPGWSIVPSIQNPIDLFSSRPSEHLRQIRIDDSRNLLYTLSSKSTIRTYHMDGQEKLTKVIEKEKYHCLRDVAHMINDRSPLLDDRMTIVSLSPISSREASKLHLMALTDTGCRLFLSATSTASYMMTTASTNQAPQSMQVQFIKFPPKEQPDRGRRDDAALDLKSYSLTISQFGQRFPPGYFFDIVENGSSGEHLLFASTPDTGRIKRATPASALKYYEQCNWIDLGDWCHAIEIGLTNASFAAADHPVGFGNELAVQFDQAPSEVAVLTNSGVHIIRRKRLVDIFADTVRTVGGEDGLNRVAQEFMRQYGRSETISAALAVACGQGSDLRTGTSRAQDHKIEDNARTMFVDFGGQPTADAAQMTADSVRLSARHDALALYLSRLVRALWKARVIKLGNETAGPVSVNSTVPTAKLIAVQENIERLRNFLETNRASIQGLARPSDHPYVTSRQGEVALMTEHQSLDAMQKIMASITESISFVLMLFDERVADIYARLDFPARQGLQDLTFEALFSQSAGKDLAKTLVKAIVNRNIQNGSNVETVADALRRRCGSFCSPDDVIIFKAQEQLQRAADQGNNPTAVRQALGESLRLFERVAESLSQANLQSAVDQFVALKYYAGAIQLCLVVARERDRGNRALSWVHDGQPPNDNRRHAHQERRRCYDLIHEVLTRLDTEQANQPQEMDGRPTLAATKLHEAYNVVNESDDEVFHFGLYEWYIQQQWTDRILAIDSPHVISYLKRLAATDAQHAELLCRFYTRRSRYFEAAQIQAELAKSDFAIGIKERITLLSLAKANANVTTIGVGRQVQQALNHEVSDLLEVAHIQDDLLVRLLDDDRINEERKELIAQTLDGPIQDLSELFNNYADQAGYYDICLLIFHAADFHRPQTITETWQSLINSIHNEYEERRERWEQLRARGITGDDNAAPPHPYEMVSQNIQSIAHRTSLDSLIFPVDSLLPLVCEYAVINGQDASIGADPCWPVHIFLQLGVSHSLVVRQLERIFEVPEHPYTGRRRKIIVQWINAAVEAWLRELERRGGLGATGRGGDNAINTSIAELLGQCEQLVAQMMAAQGANAEVEELQRMRRTSIQLRAQVDRVVDMIAQGSVLFR